MIKFDFSTYMDSKVEVDTNEKQKLLNKIYNSPMAGFYNNVISTDEINKIKSVSQKIKENSNCLLVIGIGGSFLGSYAISKIFLSNFKKSETEVIYIGNDLSSKYLNEVLSYIKDKEVFVNVISKSGTTLEVKLTYQIIKKELLKKYTNEEFRKRIIVTTNKDSGYLREEVKKYGYESFDWNDDIGGRYSLMTAAHLLPLSVMNLDIDELLDGYKKGLGLIDDAYYYAKLRINLFSKGKYIENFSVYNRELYYYTEWLKQLFGESEGKDGKGILPDSVCFSTDLHSLGQFVQEGKKVLFETNLYVEKPMIDLTFPNDEANEDGMNYLAGKSVDWANKMAAKGTLQAHEETGGVPNILLTMPGMTSYDFGNMCMFFFKAIAMTTLMNDSNPFNQPGVEVYKKNMFKLLGKE